MGGDFECKYLELYYHSTWTTVWAKALEVNILNYVHTVMKLRRYPDL